MRLFVAADADNAQAMFLREVLAAAGWDEGEPWDLYFSTEMPADEVFERAGDSAWVAHLPGSGAVGNKNDLAAGVEAARTRVKAAGLPWPRRYPRTWLMPEQQAALLTDAEASPQAWYLLKPASESCGRGIEVWRRPGEVPSEGSWIVQRYVRDPLLLCERKHVLRVYLLLSSIDPLVAWVHRDGFVKFASRPWSESAPPEDRFVHLTNPDVNEANLEIPCGAFNRPISDWRVDAAAAGVDVEVVWTRIREALAFGLAACRERLRDLRAGAGAFELLGADVLIDAQHQPWVMEMNFSPDLGLDPAPGTRARELQAKVKRAVVRDLAQLLGLLEGEAPRPMTRERLRSEAGRAGGFELLLPALDCALALGEVTAADVRLADPQRWRFEPVSASISLELEGELCLDGPLGPVRLNHSAGLVWYSLRDGADFEGLACCLEAQFGIPQQVAEKAVEDALAGLLEAGAIRATAAENK